MSRPARPMSRMLLGRSAVFSFLLLGSMGSLSASAGSSHDVASLLSDATAAFKGGRLDAAADLFAQAGMADPQSAAPARGACEVALAMEEKNPKIAVSRDPCHRALRLGGMPEDERNEVASLMSPARTPSLDDLAVSALLVDAAQRQAVDQPWTYLARCDIARRAGSADTLAACLDDLRRVAPTHPATVIARAEDAGHASIAVWIARALLLIALVGTPIHSLYRARKTGPRRDRRGVPGLASGLFLPCLLACLLEAMLGVSVAQADTARPKDHLSHFAIDDADPESSVPAADEQIKQPLEFGYFLQDLTVKAQQAAKKGDHAAEARYYRALTKAAPETAFGPRSLCNALEATEDLPNAIVACRTALTRDGSTSGDYIHFVKAVLRTTGPLQPGERQELEAVITHLAHETQLGALPTMLRCDVALRFNDWPALDACATKLAETAPNDPKTVSLQWALAIHKGDRGMAIGLIDRARETGMSPDGLAKMQRRTRAMTLRHLGSVTALAVIAALVAALAIAGLRRAATSRRRLAI
jgi:hypothetical protein